MRLIYKQFFFVLLPVMILLGLLAAVLYYHNTAVLKKEMDRRIMTVSRNVEELISYQIDQIKERITYFLSSGLLYDYFMYARVGKLDMAEDLRASFEESLVRYAGNNRQLRIIELIEVDGTGIVNITNGRANYEYTRAPDAAWVAETLELREGEYYLSDVRSFDEKNEPGLLVSALYYINGEPKCLVRIVVSAQDYLGRMPKNLHTGKDESIYLINPDGVIIARTDSLMAGQNISRLPSTQYLLTGRKGRLIETDPVTRRSLVKMMVPLKTEGFGMILSQPIAEAFGSARQIRDVSLWSSIIIGAGMLLFISLVNRQFLIRPIIKISETVQGISQGNFDVRAHYPAHDELGRLAEKINIMAERLKETTVSRESLLKEVEERKQIEAILLEVNKDLVASQKKAGAMLEDLEKAHRHLEETQSQLLQSEKLASLGLLASGVAHEINNPLGFISSNLQTLNGYCSTIIHLLTAMENLKSAVDERDWNKASAATADIKQMTQDAQLDFIISDADTLIQESIGGAERIRKIISDLRIFARPGGDRLDVVHIDVVIESILSIVWNEIKYKAELKKIYGDAPPLKVDSQKLGQVFINILVNAAQAIRERGVIEIRTYVEDGRVCAAISDTGSGIPPENIKKIFDPFFTTKPTGQGTGLGLSVSHEIVKSHGGRILVQSEVNKGTTFIVQLPVPDTGPQI